MNSSSRCCATTPRSWWFCFYMLLLFAASLLYLSVDIYRYTFCTRSKRKIWMHICNVFVSLKNKLPLFLYKEGCSRKRSIEKITLVVVFPLEIYVHTHRLKPVTQNPSKLSSYIVGLTKLCESDMIFHLFFSHSFLIYTHPPSACVWLLLFIECAAQNNCFTKHLAKILIHLAWCLQALVGTSGVQSEALSKAVNALHISSVFLKYLIENAKGNTYEELYLSMDDSEALPDSFPRGMYLDSLFIFLGKQYSAVYSVIICMTIDIYGLPLYECTLHVKFSNTFYIFFSWLSSTKTPHLLLRTRLLRNKFVINIV